MLFAEFLSTLGTFVYLFSLHLLRDFVDVIHAEIVKPGLNDIITYSVNESEESSVSGVNANLFILG